MLPVLWTELKLLAVVVHLSQVHHLQLTHLVLKQDFKVKVSRDLTRLFFLFRIHKRPVVKGQSQKIVFQFLFYY